MFVFKTKTFTLRFRNISVVLKILKAIKKTKNLSKSGKLSEVRIDYLLIITHNVNHDCNFEVFVTQD